MGTRASDALVELLRPTRLTAVVDVGANPIGSDPPYKKMLAAGLCTVVGFEPQAAALAELERRKGPHERYLPYAVGNGGEQSLHVCRENGMTSLLEPDPDHLALFDRFTGFGAVERVIRVETRRLDEIEEIQDTDFLKIDAQGSELSVFESGRARLARAVVVQTEVSFVTLYRQQPAFGAIDTFLRAMGYQLHCFAALKRWPIAPAPADGDAKKPVHQFLEADAVYVRDFSRPENMDAEQWKHLAIIAHHCYGSHDLALRAIASAEKIGALSPEAVRRYRSMTNLAGAH
jgi:FkbM family methyltransferase